MEPFSNDEPIYRQIIDRLCHAVVRGQLLPGQRLPSVREMAMEFGVNPNTIARVHQELERMGVTETRRGQGSFLTTDAERIAALRRELSRRAIGRLISEMDAMGFSRDEILRSVSEYLAGGSKP
jgi:GntR family transcriptional regulator